MFNLPTYRITPSAYPIKCPPQCPSPILPHHHPSPPLPPSLVHFPELGVFMFCLPFWYFLPLSSPFPLIPFHYYLYFPNEWDHIMFVLLWLTYSTQHNPLQFHPHVFYILYVCVYCKRKSKITMSYLDIVLRFMNFGDPWVAQRFSACLWPRAWSWRPGIKSHVGLPVHGACFSLCLCLCLSVYLMNK